MNITQMIRVSQSLVKRSALVLAALGFATATQASITWNLPGNGNWNTNTANWATGAGTTTFADDGTVDVLFTNSNGGTITISANMSPLSTTVSAASGTYTFTGGPIDNGSLTKSGNGTLSFGAANTFAGALTLTGGKLQFNNGTDQTGTGPLNIGDGTVLYNSGNSWTYLNNSVYNINGNFSLGAGANNYISFGNNVVLGGSYTITNDVWFAIAGNISDGGNGYSLTKEGTGKMDLNGTASTYTGKTIVKNGKITGVFRNAGVASSFGAPTGANAVIDLYNGTALGCVPGSSTDRLLNLAGIGPGTVKISSTSNGGGTIGGITVTGTGSKTLVLIDNTFYGSDPGTLTVTGGIVDSSDNSPVTLSIPFASTHSGNLVTLNGANTFSGSITIGASTSGKLTIGSAGQLGGGNYTNTIAINTGSIFDYASSANQILSGAISGAGKLTKSGSGSLTLSAANTYTGTTTVNFGKLIVSGSTASSSAVTVAAGGTLGGTGTVSGAVTNAVGTAASAGGAINLVDGAAGTLSLGSTLTFNGTAANPNYLYFDLGNAGSNDKIMVSGVHAAPTASGTLVNLNQLPGTTGSGTYTLIQGGVGGNNFTGYTLATTRAGRNLYSALGASGNNLQVTVAAGNAGDDNPFCYWKGSTAVWNTQQWYADAGATSTCNPPGYSSNVRFAASTPGNLSNTLGQDYEINSLTVDSGLAATTIAGNMLTIDATADNSNTAGNGIVVSNILGTTISSAVGLSGSQMWTVASNATLTVLGIVNDFGAGNMLTKSGTGTLYLKQGNNNTPNTWLGGLTLAQGKLSVSASGWANATGYGPFVQADGTSIYLDSNNWQTFNNSSYTLNGTLTMTSQNGSDSLGLSTGNTTLGSDFTLNITGGNGLQISGNVSGNNRNITLTGGGNLTILGNIMTGTGGVTNNSAGTLTLSGVNSFTGKTVVRSGTLTANISSSLGMPTGANAVIDLYNGTTFNFSSGTGVSSDRIINLAGTGSGTVTVTPGGNNNSTKPTLSGGFTATGTGAKILQMLTTGNAGIMYVAGPIPDVSDGSPMTVQVPYGSGNNNEFHLSGVCMFSGPLTIGNNSNKGLFIIEGSGQLGGGSYINTISLNGSLITFNYASTAAQTLSGLISGAGGLTLSGAGTLTLSAANTYLGTTTLSAGTLALGHNQALQNSLLSIGAAGSITISGTTPTIGGLSGSRALASVVTSGYSGSVTALTLNPQAGVSGTYSGVIADGAVGMTLTKNGPGTQILQGNQTYSGTTTVSAGTLQLGTGTSGQDGSVASASIVDNALLVFNNFGTQTCSGNISGTGKLVKNGAGKLVLSGANNYSDSTTVNTGILQYDSLGAIASSGRNITVNAPGAVALGYDPTVASPASTIQADLIDRIATNSTGSLALSGGVTENLDFSDMNALSLGANGTATYTGTLTPNGNTYRLGGGGGTLTFTPASYDNSKGLILFGNGNIGSLNFGGTILSNAAVTIYGGTLTNGTLAGTAFNLQGGTLYTVLDGNGAALVKTGTNTLTLAGAAVNTFTGGVTILGGTLLLDFANLAPPTDLINSANTLTLGGGNLSIKSKSSGSTSQTLGNVTVNAGGGKLLGNVNGGTYTTITLGSLTATANGGSLLVGTAGANTNGLAITTTTASDGQSIYGGRTVWFNGTANTGYDWATSSGGPAYTLAGLASGNYTAMLTAAVTDSYNDVIASGTTTLAGNQTHNTLKLATGTIAALGANTLTLTSGGLLSVGTGASTISGTANPGLRGSASGDLIVHQYNSGGLTISAIIGDNGGATALTKAGTGTLTLSGANTYTGTNYVNAGVLLASTSATALGSTAAGTIVFAGASLQLANAAGLNVGAEALTLNGTGVSNDGALHSLGGDKSFAGAITLGSSARIQCDNNTWNLTSASGIAGTNTDLALGSGGGTQNVTGPVNLGSGGLTKDGGGTWALNGANNWTGPTTINAGTLSLGVAGTVSIGNTITINGASSVLQFVQTQTQGTHFGYNISGTGRLQNNGLLTLRGVNSYSGGTTVAAANDNTLIFDNDNSLGSGAITFNASTSYLASYDATAHTLANSVFFVTPSSSTGYRFGTWSSASRGTGNLTFTGPVLISGATPIIGVDTGTTATFSNVVSSVGAYGMTKNGSGTLRLAAANTYSGNTTISAGKIVLDNALALQNSTYDTTGSTGGNGLDVNGFTSLTFGGLQGSVNLVTAITNYSNVAALTLNPQAGASPSYSGVITNGADGMTLTKSGPGTQTLTGANTYSGGTTISSGILAVSGSGTLGSGDVSVLAGGMLSLSTSSAISNSKRLTLAISAVVTLAAGVNETVNELYIDGKLQKKGTWGTSGSSPLPANIDNIHFTGTGILTVLKGPPDGTMISFY